MRCTSPTANASGSVTAYTLAFGSLLLVGGRIGDNRGRKPTLGLVGLIGFAAASAAGGAAQSFGVLVGGACAAGRIRSAARAHRAVAPHDHLQRPGERGRAFGVFGSVAISGAALGLLLGGALTEYLSWRWCLFVNLAFAIPAAAAALTLLAPGAAADKRRIDVPGTVTATVGLLALVYGFNHAETHGWGRSATTLASGPASSCSRPSAPSSAVSRIRCCRRAWCSTATAAGATSPSGSSASGCSGPPSS